MSHLGEITKLFLFALFKHQITKAKYMSTACLPTFSHHWEEWYMGSILCQLYRAHYSLFCFLNCQGTDIVLIPLNPWNQVHWLGKNLIHTWAQAHTIIYLNNARSHPFFDVEINIINDIKI